MLVVEVGAEEAPEQLALAGLEPRVGVAEGRRRSGPLEEVQRALLQGIRGPEERVEVGVGGVGQPRGLVGLSVGHRGHDAHRRGRDGLGEGDAPGLLRVLDPRGLGLGGRRLEVATQLLVGLADGPGTDRLGEDPGVALPDLAPALAQALVIGHELEQALLLAALDALGEVLSVQVGEHRVHVGPEQSETLLAQGRCDLLGRGLGLADAAGLDPVPGLAVLLVPEGLAGLRVVGVEAQEEDVGRVALPEGLGLLAALGEVLELPGELLLERLARAVLRLDRRGRGSGGQGGRHGSGQEDGEQQLHQSRSCSHWARRSRTVSMSKPSVCSTASTPLTPSVPIMERTVVAVSGSQPSSRYAASA